MISGSNNSCAKVRAVLTGFEKFHIDSYPYPCKTSDDKNWSSVSNSSLVRPWFQSKTNLVQKFMDQKQILVPRKILGPKNLWF